VHGTIGDIDIVEGEPARDEVGGQTLPISVVLVPEHGVAIVCGFEQGLVVIELEIGTKEALGNVENGIVIDQFAKVHIAFTHLHDLEHLCGCIVFFGEIIRVADGQVAKAVVFSCQCKFSVIFLL